MPVVRQMNPDTTQPEKVTITQKDVETVSAATIIPNSQPVPQQPSNLAIPTAFTGLTTPDKMDDPVSDMGIWIGFAHNRAKNWPVLTQLGMKDGDPYISYDRQITKLVPFKYWLVTAKAYKSTQTPAGAFEWVTTDLNQTKSPSGRRAEEHYVSVAIVEVAGKLVPAKLDARTTKSAAVANPIMAIKQAATPEWGRQTEAHKIASAFTEPWGRVFNTLVCVDKTSKTSGIQYQQAIVTSNPATIEQLQKLANAMGSADFLRQVDLAMKAYNERVQLMDKLASQN